METWNTIKDYLSTPPEQSRLTASSPSHATRKAQGTPSRAAKASRAASFSPREYQASPYPGGPLSRTYSASVDDGEPAPRIGRLGAVTTDASPGNLKKAMEVKALLEKAAQITADLEGSDAESLVEQIEEMEDKMDVVAEEQRGRPGIVKAKPGLRGYVEIQPDSGSEDTDEESVAKIPAGRMQEGQLLEKHWGVLKATPATTTSTSSIGPKPDEWDDLTNDEKWSVKPNLRAREMLLSLRHSLHAPEVIRSEVGEPEYALRDAEIRDGLWQVMDQMERLSRRFFDFKYTPLDGVVPEEWYTTLLPQTAKVIGCVASGGPAGVHGWHDMFIDRQKRRALVCAIIGNVLVEQVFQHIFFGGDAKDIEDVTALQEKHRNEDGFDRNTHYAGAIREILTGNSPVIKANVGVPSNFTNHVNHIIGALWTHLKPIYRLGHRGITAISSDIFEPLHAIVTQSGLLSLHMRIDPHTVYHFEPVFKEDNFTFKSMECFNQHDMEQRHPRTEIEKVERAEQIRRATLSEREKQRAKNDEPLTQIILMHGVCAYRLGGWETARSTIQNPVYEKPEYPDEGVRARTLMHGWVYCRWGQARGYKDGKVNKGDEKTHGAAWKGGFVEFTDVPGVPQWLEMQREEKKRSVKVRAQGV